MDTTAESPDTPASRDEPDSVSPTIGGYFRIPAVWIGERPDATLVRTLNPTIHHETVLRRNLRCGLKARVQRDGLFVFDFADWPRAPQVVLPGFRRIVDGATKVPKAHIEAERKAGAYIVFRSKIMNAHQACLTTAEAVVKHRGAMMGYPIDSRSMHQHWSFEAPQGYAHNIEYPYALASNVLNGLYQIQNSKPAGRRLIEIEVVDYSLKLLDDILLLNEDPIVDLVEAFYVAAIRAREARLGEALTLAWTACEQLVSRQWSLLLDEIGADRGTEIRMNKDRRKKLTGRDYSASVMTEILESHRKIDFELYELLNRARKARNDWSHFLKQPSSGDVWSCMKALKLLFQNTMGLNFALQTTAEGGAFPQINVETLRGRDGLG